jgi:hypothetical protein
MIYLTTKGLARVAGCFSFCIVAFILIIILDTVYQEPPFEEISSEYSVVYDTDKTWVKLHRTFRKVNSHDATLLGELRHGEEYPTYQIPSSLIDHSIDFYQIIVLPPDIKGDWCIDAEIRYSYRLSVMHHVRELKDICIKFQ